MNIETDRLRIYTASCTEMQELIHAQKDEELKKAYTEMLEGSLNNPEQWEWYAVWMIDLKDGTHIGDLNFKGIDAKGVVEIGYGIDEEYQNQGYATEAVAGAVHWADRQPGVTCIEAETDPDNAASQHVLAKCGFIANGIIGEEGPRFTWQTTLRVNNIECQIVKFLGKGKGGYSYLVTAGNTQYVLKQIHHEPCEYYTFGNKLESELKDYEALRKVGIAMPRLIEVDTRQERILKEYIDGETIFDLVRTDRMEEVWLKQVQDMCQRLYTAELNIDYFPTNFIPQDGILYYIDYECNSYMREWDFEHWGIKYWSKSPEFLQYIEEHRKEEK